MSIISKAKNGDKEAFTMLIEEHKVCIYKTALAIMKDEDDACDAMQEALLSIYENLQSLKNDKYFKTWAIRIVINKCYHIINKRNLNNEKVAKARAEVEANNFYEDNINKTEMEIALGKLDDDIRLVIVMYYYDDLATKDIAKILNIPKGTVQSRLQRGREKLYHILEAEEVCDNVKE